MKGYWAFLVFLVFCPPTFSQEQPNAAPRYGFPPSSRMESRQGQDGQPDVISHRHIPKYTQAKCIQVEHHPKQGDDGAACLLRLDSGEKYKLKYGESVRFSKDDDAFLECLGDKPTRCMIGLW